MDTAAKVVAKIVKDLKDRKGLKQEWNSIDDDIRKEIVAQWEETVRIEEENNDVINEIRLAWGQDRLALDEVSTENKNLREKHNQLQAELETIRRIVGCEEGTSVSEAVAAIAKALNETAATEPVYEWDLRKQGGPWLGAARKWLQHRRTTKGVHGDQVRWGDPNAVFEISAASVEDLAAEVAAAAFNEQGDHRKTIDRLRRKLLRTQMGLPTE